MARLRVSFSNAIKMVFDLTKDNAESLESAVHKAALEFNENESELLQKVKSIIDRESRKTGKVGRPPKKNVEEVVKTNKRKNEPKKAANSDNSEKPVKASENQYLYSGPVDVYCLNGEVSTLNVSIKISAYDENDAILRIYEDFFNKRLPLCIGTKNWKKYITKTN